MASQWLSGVAMDFPSKQSGNRTVEQWPACSDNLKGYGTVSCICFGIIFRVSELILRHYFRLEIDSLFLSWLWQQRFPNIPSTSAGPNTTYQFLQPSSAGSIFILGLNLAFTLSTDDTRRESLYFSAPPPPPPPRKKGHPFADDTFECIFMNEYFKFCSNFVEVCS